MWGLIYHIAGNILVVWPQTDRKKILAEFKFGSGVVSGLFITEQRRLSLEALEQSHEFANLQEIKLAAS